MSLPVPEIDVNALMRGLVHELRNPLSAILTASSLLQPAQGMDEESAMLLEVVQSESRRMNRILTEFSSFVKPPTPHLQSFDMARSVRDVARDVEKEAGFGTRIVVHDELPPELIVRGDPDQTAQALRHVLLNAAEAMESGGALRLAARIEGEKTMVCIEDSGAGLRQNALEQAFQPFFSTKPAATGLGLSIARGLLRAEGGDLHLENLDENAQHAEGEHSGARVKICLPASSQAAHPGELT
jgi:signal transduction histidine kinase